MSDIHVEGGSCEQGDSSLWQIDPMTAKQYCQPLNASSIFGEDISDVLHTTPVIKVLLSPSLPFQKEKRIYMSPKKIQRSCLPLSSTSLHKTLDLRNM